MTEQIEDLTKNEEISLKFVRNATIKICQDSFDIIAKNWETEFPSQPIPEGFRNMMDIQFEFLLGILFFYKLYSQI